MKKRIVSLLLTLVMVLSLVPMSVFAADNHDGQVHVIVENTTYPEAEGAPWEGTLVEEWIDLDEDSTMMGCVVKALEKNGYEQTGAENNYISSIQGLGEFDGGSMSGWMGTLNDWFTNRGFGDFTVAAGTLGSGDEIRIMYTRNGYGADLGGSWDNHIKTVKALTFSAGELSPAFDPDTHEYTLTVDKGTDSVLVTPTASNKNYQVRTYVGETEYKRTAMVPTVDGTTITVKCGDPSWPNMNNDNEPAQVYTVNVKVKSDDKPVTPTNTKVLVRAQDGGAWLHQPMVSELTGGEAEKYGYTDKVEGVSALDALVVSHELTFGDDFTPETAKDFLEVSSSGFITKLYGTETYVCGFYVNAGYPNDGTKAPSGPGYNGTTVVNTKLKDGDVVDFFFYADDTAYSDYYTWIDVPETMVTGEAITVTVKGFYAVEGYRYKDAAELKAAARPLEGVGLAWVDADGYIKPIKGVVTDEDGQATFTVGSEATGYLVAQSGGDVYALMNPSDYIRKVAGKPVETLGLTIRSQADNAYLQSMDKELEVASNTAEKYGFTDKVEGVSVLDALVAAHELVYGDKFTPATAKQYLAIDPNTDWESKVFGRETGFHGFYINNDFPTNEAGAARPKVTDTKLLDGDVLDYFVGSDAENQNDYYTWLEVPATMTSGEDITVTVKGVKAMDPDATQAAAQPLEGVGLAWVDMATGTIKPIEGVVTDENGKATFTVVEGAATGRLVAITATYHTHTTYALMNPSAPIQMVTGNVHTVELKGLHNAQLNSLKLYTYKDGVKGTQDLLSGISTEADGYGLKYTVSLPSGTYWADGYDANKDCNGGVMLAIADDTTSVSLQRAYEIYARNSGWVAGTDYTIDYQVTTADGVKRTATLGSGTVYGNLRTTGIFVETDTVTVNLIPSEAHTANYNVGTKTVVTKVGDGAQSFAISVPKAYTVKVTAPAGSTVSVGTFGNYYTYEFLRPLEDSTATKDGDTVTVTYRAPETSLNHFVRVQNPDGVTYWDFNKWTTDQDIVVTRDDLHMDDDFNKDTVSRFDKNTYDLGNVYLNINSKGYMNMNAGDTYELDVFRNWQAIEGFMNAKIALPDAHYEVVDFDGKPSDVVSIAPNADNSCLAYMTANHQGTALVKVTYDAMTHKQGQSSTADKTFSAIWPEFTGVFVVSVGADGTAIQTNMLMDRMDVAVTKDEQKQLDAEHDILFYLGTGGASYTFTPESGCTVTVARSTVGKTMTFNGFTSEGVTVDAETGAVTVANLTTGRHIVRVEKDGVATYQVITARGVSYKLLDAEGNELPENAEVKPGETVQLQFTGLVSPKEKMAGVYNHRFSLYYTDADGNFFQSNPGGYYGVYDFSGNPARQRISITVPADQEGLTYELTGAIKVGGYPGKPTHRIVTYAEGMGMQHGTATASVLAQLPQVTLKLSGYAADAVEKLIDAIGTVTLDSEETIKAARDAYDALTEEQKAQVGNYQTLLDAEAKLADLKAVDAVEKLIDAIGTVTLDSEETIKAARDAYDALTEEQKAQVGNYQTLLDAEAKLADLKAVDAVEKLIDAIGTVTLDSEETIKAARDAYDALTEEQKAQVGNYQTLLDAEAKLADLKAVDAVEKLIDAIGTVTLDSEETIKAARDAYDALTEEQKAQVGNYQTLLDAEAKLADLKAADAVEQLIDAIGTVTLDSEKAIKAARDGYDALSDAQKELVGNYQTLLDAEAKLADLQAAYAVEKLIDAIGTVTLNSEKAIKAARGAYDALTDAQKELVGNYQTLLDAEAKLAQLKKDAEKPSQPEQPEKPATGDAGVALWLTVMCMTSLLGAALVGKKRKA